MYLLDADDDAIPALREALAPLGDSLVVVGGEGLWNVHVHVDDVGAAVEAGHRGRPPAPDPGHPLRRAGRGASAAHADRAPAARSSRSSPARGCAELFADAGARRARRRPGRRPSTDGCSTPRGQRRRRGRAAPQRPDVVAVAEAAAAAAEAGRLRVAVIPTRAQVQGLAALAVHDAGPHFDDDVVEMTAAARHARTARSRWPPAGRSRRPAPASRVTCSA